MEIFVGFDSAWADNPRKPGAIALLKLGDSGDAEFEEPRIASFAEAADLIEQAAQPSDFCLVAIDQPTLVPNQSSCRPVERVAGALISALRGGVQPANRNKIAMFGDHAPIWTFLERLGARENPEAARASSEGLFLIEVFPALALPGLIDGLIHRRRGAKYNPANRRFSQDDWRMVCIAVAENARKYGAEPLAEWAARQMDRTGLRKSDQDRLDAAICLLIAIMWRRAPRDSLAVIGDGKSGYMVSPVSPRTRQTLEAKAAGAGVPVDHAWDIDALR